MISESSRANHLPQWAGRTALVVDDSRSTRMEMSRVLHLLGFSRVLEAEEGRTALKLLENERGIDFLLTDLNMPVMDGVELLSEIERRYSQRFFVAVMSSVDPSLLSAVREIAENSEFEMIGILPKPVTADALCKALANVDPDRHAKDAVKHAPLSLSTEEFRQALECDEIVVFYQPKIELAFGRVCGMEALARWKHPQHGLVPPIVFIDFIEAGELAYPHFFHQVDAAMRMLKRTEAICPGLTMNVNLPVVLLVVPDLADKLLACVNAHGLSPDQLTLEVTETSVMSNLKASLSTLTRLRLKGFGISMDDYGTGYSSMQQLAKCPFTELKIDKSFVHDASRNRKLLSILTAAISICDQLGLFSVAEGCESEDDLRQITALGYKATQGYYFSPPLPEEALLAYLEAAKNRRAPTAAESRAR